MGRTPILGLLALAAASCATSASADSRMVQSPLLMRRAGPSCQPGHLGGEEGAGYRYALGPCAGVDGTVAAPALRTPRRLPGRV